MKACKESARELPRPAHAGSRNDDSKSSHASRAQSNTTDSKTPKNPATAPISADLKSAFVLSLPLVAGYLMLGMAFGILFAQIGFNWLWAALSALFIYGGTMQFIAVSLIAARAGFLDIFLTSLMVGFRQIFYALVNLKDFKAEFKGAKRFYMFFALSDEVFALLAINKHLSSRAKLIFALLSQSYWIAGCALGAALGGSLGFVSSLRGVEFVLTATFLVIILEQVRDAKSVKLPLLGAVLSVAALLIFGAANFLIPSMFAIVLALLAWREIEGRIWAHSQARLESRDFQKGKT